MAKHSEYLYALAVSDIHLHHPRTPTSLIISNLRRDIIDNPEARELDILWIPGDLVDRLMTVPDESNHLVQRFLVLLLRFCKLYAIRLRVLEGTGSHDYGQSKMLVTLNESTGIDADLRYYPKLAYDTEEDLGISVLYIPDELNSDSSVTWHQVKKLLDEFGVEKVDYAIMHGLFEFQLPAHVVDVSAHLSERYESIVDRHIIIGHHHTHRIEGKVIVPGSFDRLAHGEEGPKGSVWIKDYGHRTQVRFLENHGAKRYTTINLHDLALEDAMARLDAVVAGALPGSAFFVKANAVDPAAKLMDVIKGRYEDFVWTSAFERDDQTSTRIDEIELNYTPIRLERDNLPGLVQERLTTHDHSLRTLAMQLLEEAL